MANRNNSGSYLLVFLLANNKVVEMVKIDISRFVDFALVPVVLLISLLLLSAVLSSLSSEDIFAVIAWLVGTLVVFVWLCLFWMALRCSR